MKTIIFKINYSFWTLKKQKPIVFKIDRLYKNL